MKISGKEYLSKIQEYYRSLVKKTQRGEKVDKGEFEKIMHSSEAKSTRVQPKDEEYTPTLSKIELIKFATEVVAKTPEVRDWKIQEIKRRIEAGTYNVDSRKVAEKLLTSGIFDDLV